MKLNATPRHYMPLSQNQSDEDESGPCKEEKNTKMMFKSSFDASATFSKSIIQSEVVKVDIKNLPMSPLRRLVFIASLIMCVLFVVIFVYFIPCSNSNRTFRLTCKWKRIFHDMSFNSLLEFANYKSSLGTPLIILSCKDNDSNLVAVQENNGKEHWKLHFHANILSSLCNTIDINLDGIPECLIIGNKGLFAAVDVEKGSTLWYLHNHSDIMNAQSVYGPSIVPDCDDDGIMDIIVSYHIDKEDKHFYLAFVSGATGQIIGSLLELPHCTAPATEQFLWKSKNESHIILYCAENGNGYIWMLSTREACDVAFQVSAKLSQKNIFRVPPFAKHIDLYKPSTSEDKLVIVLDGVKFLLLEKSYSNFQLKWKTYVEGEQHMKILTDGHFMKESNHLVITSLHSVTSKVMGIRLKDGKVMDIALVNGSVKSAVKLPNYFGNADGLILKVVTSDYIQETKGLYQNLENNSSEAYLSEDYNKIKDGSRVYDENYILLKYEKNPILRTIHSEKVLVLCKGADCYPDSYIKDSTVLVKRSEINFSFDVVTVTSTILPIRNAAEEMIVNFFSLENISTWCSTCAG